MKTLFTIVQKFALTLSLVSLAALTSGCNDNASSSSQQSSNQSKSTSTLSVLAGSELKDMEGIFQKAARATGVELKIEYTGTIEGVERIKNDASSAYDTALFSQSKYFFDSEANAQKIKGSEKFMYSPIAVGMRQKAYRDNALAQSKDVSWGTLYELVATKNLKYAMTDPSASNTGLSALMGITYSTARKTEAITDKDINSDKLRNFFKGHLVNSGSSGWLVEAFKDSQADFMINYESVLLQYNRDNPSDRLEIIYPKEGIMTADYPYLLLNLDKAESYKKIVAYMRSVATQKEIIALTQRRVLSTDVMSAEGASVFPKNLLIEMAFNPSAELTDKLLGAYFQDYKKPSAVVFVLDVSGSMMEMERVAGKGGKSDEVSRIDLLKQAMSAITVGGAQSQFTQLRNREKVWLIPFGTDIKDVAYVGLTGTEAQNESAKNKINTYVQSLSPRSYDRTYLFSSILAGVEILEKEKVKTPGYQYSVVVLTDGDSNEGINVASFVSSMERKNVKGQIRVFPIVFGAANSKELSAVAHSTGGKVFDGKSKSLSSVFKEIRTYQ